MKCFDITSESLTIFIFIIRTINQLTIYNFQSIINDPAIQYFLKISNLSQLSSGNTITDANIGFLVAVFLILLVFFVCIFTFKKEVQIHQTKVDVIRFQALLIMAFRVFLVKNLSEISYLALEIQNYIIFGISILLIIFVTMQVFLIEEFTVQISLIKSNKSLFSKNYHLFNGLSEFLLLFTVAFIPYIPKQKFEVISAINIVLALSFLMKLTTSIFRKKYTEKLVENLQIFSCIACLVFYLLFIPANFIQLLKQNFILTTLAIVVFLYKSFTNFLAYFQQDSLMYIQSIPKLREQLLSRGSEFFLAQGHYLIHYINHLMRQFRGEKEQILLGSILSEHFRLCRNPECYCMNKQEENKNKLIMDPEFRSKFLLSFVENIYRQFCEEFDIFALYLIFKLEIVGIFPEIESSLVKYELSNPSLKIYQQFLIYQIKKLLKKFIDDKNKNADNVRLQKVLLQQEKQKELIEKLKELLDLNIKKYKLLSQAICNLNLVEENCLITAKLTQFIELSYLQTKNRNEYNLFTQSIYYFYYAKISETNTEASSIYSNIYTKNMYLKSLKGLASTNIEKFMYDDRCCVFESNLQPETLGTISNVTQNCYQIFGIKKQDLLFKSIRKLIPKFMNEEHDVLLKDWLQTGSFRNFNKKKITYVNNNKSICFKAMIYLQVSTTFERMKIYILVFKIEGEHYLLLDNKLSIQAYGQKIKDHIFSMKVLQQPLRNFCYNINAIPSDYMSLEVEKKCNLELYLSEEKESNDNLQNSNRQLSFAEKIQQFADKALRKNRQIKVFKCKVQFSLMKLANLSYFIMRFVDVHEVVMSQSQIDELDIEYRKYSQSEKFKTLKNQSKSRKSLFEEQSSNQKLQMEGNPTLKTGLYENQTTQHVIANNSSTASLTEGGGGAQQDIGPQQFQSTSSMMSEQASYSFKKLINHIKQTFLFQKRINYHQLNNISLILLILILILFGCLIFQYFFYQTKLQNFQEIMTANQQVSDTLQYLQLMFSQILLINQHCNIIVNNVQCNRSIGELKANYNTFYKKISSQFLNSIQLRATEDFPYYMYLQEEIDVKIGKAKNIITIHNFIETFYYSIQKIVSNFLKNQTMSQQTQYLFDFLNDNWNIVITINRQTITLYEQKGLSQMDIIQIILYSVSSCIFIINVGIIIVTNHFISNSLKRKQIMIRSYELVPISYIEAMKRYFENIIKLLNKKKFIYNDDENTFPQIDDNPYYRPKSQFFYSINSIKRIMLFLLFFSLLLLSNFISLYNMRTVLQPFKTTFIETNSLILAEKNVFESYYQLKQLYLLQKNTTIKNNKLAELKKYYDKSQLEFNKKSIALLKSFEDSQNNYASDFKKLLTNNICDLSKSELSDWQYTTCKDTLYSYPDHGIFATFIFIQRAATISQFQLANFSSPVQALTQPHFLDLDIYSSYLMKVFYMMQSRISDEMKNSLNSAYKSCLLTILFQIAILAVSMIIWIVFYMIKRRQFINLYGNAMVFPSRIIKKTKKVLKDIQECLVLKDY